VYAVKCKKYIGIKSNPNLFMDMWEFIPALQRRLQVGVNMNRSTVDQLNQINRVFYQITADEFDQTRAGPWPGWEKLLPYLPSRTSSEPLTVLDVGCGNGRFGVFLREKLGSTAYHGMDSSPRLLEHARAALPDGQFEQRDIIESPPDSGDYDVVVLLGVLHHIPGYTERQAFMRRLAERVKPGGLLVFAAWRFYEYERFRQRIAAWPPEITAEPHDYLLDWRRGQVALRYCHYVDDAEHQALVTATCLTEVATYRADGESGDANRYSILQK
jgi:2-polyprenyl-3-methyl-5-hydroxy-6-metoxy-1,4-benzoquinol methylase